MRSLPAQDARGSITQDFSTQGGFLKEILREDGGVRTAGLKNDAVVSTHVGRETMNDHRCRFDNNFASTEQYSQEAFRLFTRTDASAPTKACVEQAEAFEGRASEGHV